MTTQTQPRNAQQAKQQADRYDRALQILEEGYKFEKDANSEVIAVIKPGHLAASYWINMLTPGCDCPDAMKGNYCKHLMAWDAICAEEANELAGLEAQCAEYDDMEGFMDRVKTPTLESLAAKDLYQKMSADLQRMEAQVLTHGARLTNYITAQQDMSRVAALQVTLHTVATYR